MLKPPVPSYSDLIPLFPSHELQNWSLLTAVAFVGQRSHSNNKCSQSSLIHVAKDSNNLVLVFLILHANSSRMAHQKIRTSPTHPPFSQAPLLNSKSLRRKVIMLSQLTYDYPCYFQFDNHGFVVKALQTHQVFQSSFSSQIDFEW
jgi:hypothetical protein